VKPCSADARLCALLCFRQLVLGWLARQLFAHAIHVDLARLVQDLIERAGGQCAGLVIQDHLLAHDHQRGDGTDAEHPGQLGLLVGIDLGENHVLMLLRGRIEDRCERTARTAPWRPEVHDHHGVVGHRGIEVVFGQRNRRHAKYS
jgi:hypothetical protein